VTRRAVAAALPGRAPTAWVKGVQTDGAGQKIVASELDVKAWLAAVPGVDSVRPGTCPSCGRAGHPTGKQLGIIGHGLRERQQRGPLVAGGPPQVVTVRVRRYACRCGAILMVVPREMLRGRLYTASAVAWALALFGVEHAAPADVRRRTSPWSVVGATAAAAGWATLRRWVRAVRALRLLSRVRPAPPDFTDRQVAERAAMTAAAHAPPSLATLAISSRAFAGGARAA
jgi:hypothetical protein